MQCFVYASERKAGTYVWVRQRDTFGVLPAPLQNLLGELRFVMEVQLHPQRKLPHENVLEVLAHLDERGWHLQLPPGETIAVPVENQGRT